MWQNDIQRTFHHLVQSNDAKQDLIQITYHRR